MIEIIKKGTKQIITCKQCGCKFSFENEDLKYLGQDGFHTGIKQGYKKYVICPQCENEIVVEQTRSLNDIREEHGFPRVEREQEE